MSKSNQPIRKYIAGQTAVRARDMNLLGNAQKKVSAIPDGIKYRSISSVGGKEASIRLVKLEEDLYSNPDRTFKCSLYTLDKMAFTKYTRHIVNEGEDEEVKFVARVHPKKNMENSIIHARNFMFFCTKIPADAIVLSINFGFCNEWVIVQSWCTGADEGSCTET